MFYSWGCKWLSCSKTWTKNEALIKFEASTSTCFWPHSHQLESTDFTELSPSSWEDSPRPIVVICILIHPWSVYIDTGFSSAMSSLHGAHSAIISAILNRGPKDNNMKTESSYCIIQRDLDPDWFVSWCMADYHLFIHCLKETTV